MAKMDQVLDLLRRSDRSFHRARSAHRRLLIALLLVIGPFYLGALIFAVVGLVHACQGGDWLEMFWLPFAIAAPFATSITKFAVIPDDRQALYQPVTDLRAAIRSGDEALAPKAEPADSAAPFVFDPTGRVRVGPLRRPPSTAGTVYMICGGLALMALIISVPAAMAAGSSLAVLVVSTSLAPLAGLLLLLGARTLGSFNVRADTHGLRWRRPSGSPARLAWTEVHALYEVHRIAGLFGNPETHFVVAGERAALAWRLPNANQSTLASVRSADLCRVVTENTGLPLRNATTEAMRIAGQAEPMLPVARSGGNKVPRAEVLRRLKILGLISSPALVLALTAGGLQLYQPNYYEHLYDQAQSHAPLYSNSFDQPDADWPTSSDAMFVEGTYQLTEDVTEPVPHMYNNALYEVTGKVYGDGGYGGAGFVLQGHDPNLMTVEFFETPQGEAWMEVSGN